MRILTRTQYDAICDIVTEKDKKIAELEAQIMKQKDTIDYLNSKICARNAELLVLRKRLNENGLTWTATGIDFPATTKQPEDKLF